MSLILFNASDAWMAYDSFKQWADQLKITGDSAGKSLNQQIKDYYEKVSCPMSLPADGKYVDPEYHSGWVTPDSVVLTNAFWIDFYSEKHPRTSEPFNTASKAQEGCWPQLAKGLVVNGQLAEIGEPEGWVYQYQDGTYAVVPQKIPQAGHGGRHRLVALLATGAPYIPIGLRPWGLLP